jgi:hypothetical protein
MGYNTTNTNTNTNTTGLRTYDGDMAADNGGAVSALRAFRLFRLLRLISRFRGLADIAHTVAITVPAVANFCVLVLIFIAIMALFGEQLLANKMRFDEYGYHVDFKSSNFSRWKEARAGDSNTDTFIDAVTTTFQIISGEDWNVVLYDAWNADGMCVCVYVYVYVYVYLYVCVYLYLYLSV